MRKYFFILYCFIDLAFSLQHEDYTYSENWPYNETWPFDVAGNMIPPVYGPAPGICQCHVVCPFCNKQILPLLMPEEKKEESLEKKENIDLKQEIMDLKPKKLDIEYKNQNNYIEEPCEVSQLKIKRSKKARNKSVWTKLNEKLFKEMVEYERSHPSTKQSEMERIFNVNRSTYWRWKKQRDIE